ncbi:MAG: glutamate--tRNA ligase, partial [Planctomycetaceae bacterium]|nr:glutamate--tRNA ligase [Planctomycetaceae bacterium]
NIRRSLQLSAEEIQAKESAGEPFVVRYLVDRSAKVAIDDEIRGHVEWDGGLIPDPVIMRGNGMPLYNFATVIDDIDLEITHVIRAEEHLSNTPVQMLLFEALGATPPVFAHIPFVAAPGTKEKLSKREKKIEKYRKSPQFKKLFDIADDVLPKLGLGSSETLNPVMVAYYEAVGFLPEAVLNSLSRLGWSLDDKTENMSLDFVVENFTLDRVVKAPAGLDPDKLLAYQEYWMSQLPLEKKVDGCLPFLEKAGLIDAQERHREFVGRLVEALGDRLKLFSDILSYDEYFVSDDHLVYDEKAFEMRIQKPERAVELLAKYREVLAASSIFTASALEEGFKSWMESEGISYGDIIHALRVAVSGKATGPGMFDCLAILGQERCLNRLDQAIKRVAK